MKLAASASMATLMERVGSDTSIPQFQSIFDASQISRQIRHLSETLARLEDENCPLRFQVLLDRVIIALTSPQKAWSTEENFALAIQTLSRHLSADMVPPTLDGYFLNCLLESLVESLTRSSEEVPTRSGAGGPRFPFIPSILVLLPYFYNSSVRQAMLEVGPNGEYCSNEELRERTMVLFNDKRFYNVAWAPELLEQLKLLDFTPKELDSICNNINKFSLDDESIPVERVAPICFGYLSLATKTGVRLPLIMSGITHLFHILEQRIQQDDYHESQTGTQAMRVITSDKLRETENLVFITFEQYFQSHPSIALEFINITRHAIAKGGLYLFSLGLLLSMLKTSRPTKVSDKAMETLLMWCRSSKQQQAGPSNSSKELNGKYVPLVLQTARPTFEDLGAKNQRFVDATLISAGPLSLLTLKSVVSACLEGWDACIYGLVELAFEMVNLDLEDASKPKSTSKGPRAKETGFLSSVGEYSKDSADVLRKLFEGVESGVRTRIMDSLFLNLVTRPEVGIVFVEILSSILASNRGRMAPYIPKFQEMVYQIGSLPPTIAKKLIGSLETLMSSHPDFKDLVVMVLRKASFSHETTARCAASSGFVQLLRAHVRSLVISRTLSPALAEQICLECISFVRRSLSQQSFIRATLYRDLAAAANDIYHKIGLVSRSLSNETNGDAEEPHDAAGGSMEMKPPVSHYPAGTLETLELIYESIIELTLSQLSTVVMEEPEGIKFELSNCLRSLAGAQAQAAANRKLADTPSTARAIISPLSEIQEPLDVLLMSANCMTFGEAIRSNGLGAQSRTIVLYRYLERFVKFMLDSELEQFALDKTSDFSLETPEGLANQDSASLLLGIYEMCIEYLLTVVQSATHKRNEFEEEEVQDLVSETEDEAQQRYKHIHKFFRMILQLKGLMKDAKGAVKLIHPGNAKKDAAAKAKEGEEDEIEDDEEEPRAKAKKTEKAKSKAPTIRSSLFSRRCIVDLLTLLCNPIKASSLRGPDNAPVTTPLMDLANDFGAVQYVLTAALGQAQNISLNSKSPLKATLSTEDAIEGIRHNMGSSEFWSKIAAFLLYEASAGPKRVAPVGVKKTDILALEIYAQGAKIVSQDSNQNLSALSKFAANSVSYLQGNPHAKKMCDNELEPEDRLSLFVELIQGFVTPEMCFTSPQTAELWLSIIELLAPLLAPKHLISVSAWIESLIALRVANEVGSQVEERRMTNDLGLKLVPLMWSLFDRRPGHEVMTSYLMFAHDIFVTCGGNASSSNEAAYIEEDEQRASSHTLTFSVTARSTVQDITITLLDSMEKRINIIEAIHAEIENSEKFVVVGLGDGKQVDLLDPAEESDSSSSDSGSDSEEEVDMSSMMTGRHVPPKSSTEPANKHKRAPRINEMDEDTLNMEELTHNLHLKRKSVLYRDLTEMIEIFYCLTATQLPNAASVAFAKLLDRFLKLVHTWLAAKLKRKLFEPIIPAFEVFVSALGRFFGRLHVWASAWLRAEIPFLPTEEKKRTKLVQQARTAASKQLPTLVFWMEKIHAEDIIKLAARADHPALLTSFKTQSNHEIAIGQGLLTKKRKEATEGPEDAKVAEVKPKVKRPRKKKD